MNARQEIARIHTIGRIFGSDVTGENVVMYAEYFANDSFCTNEDNVFLVLEKQDQGNVCIILPHNKFSFRIDLATLEKLVAEFVDKVDSFD